MGDPSYKEKTAEEQLSFNNKKFWESGYKGNAQVPSVSAGECLSKAINSSIDLLYTIIPLEPPLTYAQEPTPVSGL